MQHKIKTAILGASGYTGAELIRLALLHPVIEIVQLAVHSNTDKYISELYPHFRDVNLSKLESYNNLDPNVEVIFSCLPHDSLHKLLPNILEKANNNPLIIDLSADFRLTNITSFNQWYNTEHQASILLDKSVYGLTEVNHELIKQAQIIACPGCYPTSVLLPLIPLVTHDAIDINSIYVDAKSGVTGAGRKATTANLFCEVHDNLKAYNISNHRHIAEIEEQLTKQFIQSQSKKRQSIEEQSKNGQSIEKQLKNGQQVYGQKMIQQNIQINFVPHLVPMMRGILSTIYLSMQNNNRIENIYDMLQNYYADSNFVRIYHNTQLVTKEVVGTNMNKIAVFKGRKENDLIIISVIDNLIKGAVGQAIQNFNVKCGLQENTGLDKLSSMI